MLIQSKKVWIADQFVPAVIEIHEGKITDVLPYESRTPDVDYGDKRIVSSIFIVMVLSNLTPMMQTKKVFVTGANILFLKE